MTEIKMKKPVLYFAQPYTNDPEKSIKFAHEVSNKLRKMGYLVYSPIEVTHYRHLWILKMRRRERKWFRNELNNNDCYIVYSKEEKEKIIKEHINNKYPIPDYVKEDLEIIEGFMNHDIEWCANTDCYIYSHECRIDNKCIGCMIEFTPRKYDSGVMIVMSNEAFEDQYLCLHCNKPLLTDHFNKMHGDYYCPRCQSWESKDIPFRKWLSKGCELEYNFAKDKKNNIKIVEVESLLKGVELEL